MVGAIAGRPPGEPARGSALLNTQKQQEAFRRSFVEYLDLLGVVPRTDYLWALKERDLLKAKVAEQEQTIAHLRALLNYYALGLDRTMRDFQELIHDQSEQFMNLMRNLTETPGKDHRSTLSHMAGGPYNGKNIRSTVG